MIRATLTFLAMAVMILLAVPGHAQERDLTIYCEYPAPEGFTLGSKGGLIYDQVWELMRRTSITKPIETVSWKRGYAEALSKPDIGLFPTTRTEAREKLFHWIGPILRVTWVFYSHADSGLVINSLEDAKAVSAIGTYANDSKEQWLREQGFTNLVSVMENLTNMRKLYEQRIDLMVGSPSVTDRWPEQFGFDPDKLVEAYAFKTVDLYLAVSKGSDMEVVMALEKAFNEMLHDGTVHTQYEKWVPGLTPPTTD